VVAAVAGALAAALFPPWARIRSRVQVRMDGPIQRPANPAARRIRSPIPHNCLTSTWRRRRWISGWRLMGQLVGICLLMCSMWMIRRGVRCLLVVVVLGLLVACWWLLLGLVRLVLLCRMVVVSRVLVGLPRVWLVLLCVLLLLLVVCCVLLLC